MVDTQTYILRKCVGDIFIFFDIGDFFPNSNIEFFDTSFLFILLNLAGEKKILVVKSLYCKH